MANASRDNLVAWKRSMVDAGLRPKTIQDAKLAPIRAIFQWDVQNKLLLLNPAEGISLDSKSKQSEKKRSFTEEEAKTLLRAALAESEPVRRWVPWIGAYSGARVSEICQLRSEDVLKIKDVWCMKLDPEAGSLKTSGSKPACEDSPPPTTSSRSTFAHRVGSDLAPVRNKEIA